MILQYVELSANMLLLFAVLICFEAVMKGIAMWRAGRNNQLNWFIALLVINTAGIMPLLYIYFFQKKRK